jgi:hypothetical protein
MAAAIPDRTNIRFFVPSDTIIPGGDFLGTISNEAGQSVLSGGIFMRSVDRAYFCLQR